jgi:hypothetical protein
MSRAIKFRAWLKDEDDEYKMISGDCLAFEEYVPLCDLLKPSVKPLALAMGSVKECTGIKVQLEMELNYERL